MLRLMIVDDNALMGNQLAAMLDWHGFGVEIVHIASDGQEAMDILQNQQVDFIMTDMDMPGVDGLELIEHISIYYPNIHVVALSSYDDFRYVRGSMKFGAHDYLLKNKLSREVLENLLTEVVSKDKVSGDMRELENVTYEQMVEAFFKRMIRDNNFDSVQIGHIIRNLNIRLNKGCLAVMLVDWNQEDEVLKRSIYHMCQQILQEADFAKILEFEQQKGLCLVLSFYTDVSQAVVLKKMEQWGRAIINNGMKFFNEPLVISISEVCGNMNRLKDYYQQATNQMGDLFYDEENPLVCAWNVDKRIKMGGLPMDFPDIRLLMEALKEGRQQDFVKEWKDFFFGLQSQRVSARAFVPEAMEVFNRILIFGEEQGITKSFLLDRQAYSFEELRKIKTLSLWEQLFLSVINKLCEAISPLYEKSDYHKYTRILIKKIYTEYGNALTLGELARELNVSSAYLSNTFKQDLGIGFNEYLNQIRMEYVISRIGNGDGKLKDIVSSAGFQNYNYFFKVFKDYTGKTPTQYFG